MRRSTVAFVVSARVGAGVLAGAVCVLTAVAWVPTRGASARSTTGRIAYVLPVSPPNLSPRHVFVSRPDRSQRRRVARVRALASQPSWSPDGRRVVFSALPVFHSQPLRIVDLATRRVHALVPFTDSPQAPKWSSDGRWIAFEQPRGISACQDLDVVRPEGGPSRVLVDGGVDVDDSFGDGSQWDWAPRTATLVFSACGTGQLRVVDAQTGEQRPLGLVGTTPTWSPTGRLIAFVERLPQGSLPSRVFVATADGSTRRLLFSSRGGPVMGLSWSRDGRLLAFFQATEDEDLLWVIKRDGYRVRAVRMPDGGNDVTERRRPAWSPDGTAIAVDHALVNVRTGHVATRAWEDPAWSP